MDGKKSPCLFPRNDLNDIPKIRVKRGKRKDDRIRPFFDCQGKLSRAQRRYTSAKALSSQDKFLRETSPCACKVLIWPPRKARQGGGLPARAKEDLVKRRWKMERRDGGKKSERKVPGNSHYPIPILTQKMSSGLWKIFGDLASHLLLRVIFSRLYGV